MAEYVLIDNDSDGLSDFEEIHPSEASPSLSATHGDLSWISQDHFELIDHPDAAASHTRSGSHSRPSLARPLTATPTPRRRRRVAPPSPPSSCTSSSTSPSIDPASTTSSMQTQPDGDRAGPAEEDVTGTCMWGPATGDREAERAAEELAAELELLSLCEGGQGRESPSLGAGGVAPPKTTMTTVGEGLWTPPAAARERLKRTTTTTMRSRRQRMMMLEMKRRESWTKGRDDGLAEGEAPLPSGEVVRNARSLYERVCGLEVDGLMEPGRGAGWW